MEADGVVLVAGVLEEAGLSGEEPQQVQEGCSAFGGQVADLGEEAEARGWIG